MADSCPMLVYLGLSKFKTIRLLLFQFRTEVIQITPSISILLLAMFSYYNERPFYSFDEKSRFFVMLYIKKISYDDSVCADFVILQVEVLDALKV